MLIAENVARVRERIVAAALRAERNPNDIELMAVTKTVAADRICEAYQSGLRLFGENRVQEFESKRNQLSGLGDARWHMIGHLQTNKGARAAQIFDGIESVDSLRLAEKLNGAVAPIGRILPILIEINIGDEAAKSGVAPDSQDLENLLQAAPRLPGLGIQGLMTVPPYHDDPAQSRPFFRRMRELAVQIQKRALPNVGMHVLSMGMSHDFEVAIEEGSTRVRVGSAIFGERATTRSKD